MTGRAAEPTLWTSTEVVGATGGTLNGCPFCATGVNIDSRDLAPGDLFVALAAARDGHDFVPDALARGAAASLVARPSSEPNVQVGDTLEALWGLAAAARDRASGARRGAVTGSVGKTSVTQAILAGLRLAGAAHGSTRSFNNHIGVPLTLARMPPATRAAVFEMGMNHAGEIAPLARLVAPQAVAITNVEAAHVENFPDGEAGVARAKAEIFQGLALGGVAVLNADNPWFGFLRDEARARGAEVQAFGRAEGCMGRLLAFSPTREGALVSAEIAGDRIDYTLRLRAEHWGPMSLCALLMMRALDTPMSAALEALAQFEPLSGRGAEKALAIGEGALTLIDESYNASPVSMASALRTLGGRADGERRIAVLTDMLELGEAGPGLHAQLAAVVAEGGVDAVFCAGPLMRGLYCALDSRQRGAWAQDVEALAPALIDALRPGDVVMVKGSHASQASLVVELLARAFATAEHG
jgi:UDP-N-acetylmuramoyl-tripeptide--D-alanyl-D-alanine ligase